MKENVDNNSNVWLPFALSLMLALGMIFGYQMNEKDESPLISSLNYGDDIEAPIGQIEELIRFVETKYVDTINRDELTNSAISAILKNLDPHSLYISPDQLNRVKEDMSGSFHGIGIQSFYINDTVNIIKTTTDGPAEQAGLLPYDKILSINDSLVAGKGLLFSDIQAMIKGDIGDRLTMRLLEKSGKEKNVTITIGDIPIKSIDVALNISDEVGYIKINRFSSTTYREFMDHFETMSQTGTKHLVIDLRGNPGGYLPQTTNILSQLFTEQGKLLVYTEGRKGQRLEYKTTGKPFFKVDKIVVLIDENSASGSEIIAGAIQEWDRGVVIGRRSFGKGLVQEQYPLGNGGAVRLTVAKYYTPTGRSIQKTYEEIELYGDDIYNRIAHGELFTSDSISSGDNKQYFTKILNREVHGGGGITPDVFVPIDSLEIDYDYATRAEGVSEFVFDYIRRRNIKNSVEVNADDLYQVFMDSVDTTGSNVTNKEKEKLSESIDYSLKKYIDGDQAMYKAMLESDPSIALSLKYISSDISLEDIK